MKYTEMTRRYFEATPAVGDLTATAHAVRGSAGNRERGVWVQFSLHVQAGQIREARFLAFGCPHTIATASWVAEHAAGALTSELPEPVRALMTRFEVPQEKMGRLLILEDAWRAAVAAAALTVIDSQR